jgi:competence protein CoiA
MKFALYKGERVEAEATLKGALCPVCDAVVIARCGDKNIHHWAHKRKNECPHWWENETQWHRDWKNHFPIDWQEVVHTSKTGEKHIADIKTPNGLVVEFQHSNIKPEEILARNNFYKNIIWIVDGTRRKTDEKKFEEALEWKFWNSSRLLKDWSSIQKPVFFDFGKPKLYGILDGWIITYEKKNFILEVKEGLINDSFTRYINMGKEKRKKERKEARAWFGKSNPVTRRYRRRRF